MNIHELKGRREAEKEYKSSIPQAVEEIKKQTIQDLDVEITKIVQEADQKISAAIESRSKELATKIDGIKLLKGDNGDKGDSITGPMGPQGPIGPKGESIIGPQGKEGKAGKNGKDGKPGKNGKDGSPDKPDEVVLKVNRAKNKIKASQVEDLEEVIKDLRTSVREVKRKSKGGGGMGEPQHETFPISQGTSSITTTFPIAAKGNAIFKCAYQGQELDKGVHFTVGANRKTITFHTSLQAQFINSTTVSITYIRG